MANSIARREFIVGLRSAFCSEEEGIPTSSGLFHNAPLVGALTLLAVFFGHPQASFRRIGSAKSMVFRLRPRQKVKQK